MKIQLRIYADTEGFVEKSKYTNTEIQKRVDCAYMQIVGDLWNRAAAAESLVCASNTQLRPN